MIGEGNVTDKTRNKWVGLHFSLVLLCMVFLVLTLILEMFGGNVEIFGMAFSLLLIVVAVIPLLILFGVVKDNIRSAIKVEAVLIMVLVAFSIVTKIVVPTADIFYYSLVVLFFMGIIGAVGLLGKFHGIPIMISFENTKIWRGLAIMIALVLLVTFVRVTFSVVYGVPQSSLYTAIPFSAAGQPTAEITESPVWLFFSGYARGFLENTALICLLGGILMVGITKLKLKGIAVIAVAGVLSFAIIGPFGSFIHTGLYNPEYQTTVFFFTWLVFSIFGITMLTLLTSFATANAHGLLDGLQELSNAGYTNEHLFIFIALIIVGVISLLMWLGKGKFIK